MGELASIAEANRNVPGVKTQLGHQLYRILSSPEGRGLPKDAADRALTALARIGTAPDTVEIIDDTGKRVPAPGYSGGAGYDGMLRVYSRQDSQAAMESLKVLASHGINLPQPVLGEMRKAVRGDIPRGDTMPSSGDDGLIRCLRAEKEAFESGRRIMAASLLERAANPPLGVVSPPEVQNPPARVFKDGSKRGPMRQ